MRCFVLILLLALYSCTKVDTEPIPEGMVKLVFTADVLQTKTSLDGNIVKWTGEEQIDVWYQTSRTVMHRYRLSYQQMQIEMSFMQV